MTATKTAAPDASSGTSTRHQGADVLGVAISTLVAGAGVMAYKLLIRIKWHRQQMAVTTEKLDRLQKDLSCTQSELLNTRCLLEAKVQNLNVVIKKLEEARGDLGSRTSENQIMKQELHMAKRQLSSMQQQLERTKLELRSSQNHGMWTND